MRLVWETRCYMECRKKSSYFKSPIFFSLVGILLGLFISKTMFSVAVIEGSSMEPTYYDGNKILVSRLDTPKNGDIVILKRDDSFLIKRVIASPGDSIFIKDSKVFLNGNELSENYIMEDSFNGGIIENSRLILNSNEYFIMGDNRAVSKDSRSFGVVDKDDIIGVKLINLW